MGQCFQLSLEARLGKGGSVEKASSVWLLNTVSLDNVVEKQALSETVIVYSKSSYETSSSITFLP